MATEAATAATPTRRVTFPCSTESQAKADALRFLAENPGARLISVRRELVTRFSAGTTVWGDSQPVESRGQTMRTERVWVAEYAMPPPNPTATGQLAAL